MYTCFLEVYRENDKLALLIRGLDCLSHIFFQYSNVSFPLVPGFSGSIESGTDSFIGRLGFFINTILYYIIIFGDRGSISRSTLIEYYSISSI